MALLSFADLTPRAYRLKGGDAAWNVSTLAGTCPRNHGLNAKEMMMERMTFARTRRLMREDLAHRCAYENKPFTWTTGLKMIRHPGVTCVILYRLQCFFYANHLALLGWCLKSINLIVYGVRIDEHARIGGGLMIAHAVTILVAKNVSVGERCVFLHQNTIGVSPFLDPDRDPGKVIVGSDVTFGGGSCAFGDIVIGDGCRIGVNAVVNRSCPAGSSVFGVPAQIIGRHASR